MMMTVLALTVGVDAKKSRAPLLNTQYRMMGHTTHSHHTTYSPPSCPAAASASALGFGQRRATRAAVVNKQRKQRDCIHAPPSSSSAHPCSHTTTPQGGSAPRRQDGKPLPTRHHNRIPTTHIRIPTHLPRLFFPVQHSRPPPPRQPPKQASHEDHLHHLRRRLLPPPPLPGRGPHHRACRSGERWSPGHGGDGFCGLCRRG